MPPTMTELVLATARHADREAVVCGPVRETYGTWLRRARAVAGYLQRNGVRPGDVIAALIRNGPHASECVAIAALTGCIYLPLNAMLTGHELRAVLASARPRALIHADEFTALAGDLLASLEQPAVGLPLTGGNGASYEAVARDGPAELAVPAVDPGATFLLLYTSGTTGAPKGVALSHRAVLFSASTFISHLGFGPDSRVLLVNPHFFSAGINCCIIPALGSGCRLVALDGFREEAFFATVATERITHTQLVPTMLIRLIDRAGAAARDLSSLETVAYGSSAMPAARLTEALALFEHRLVQTYGMTEIPELVLCLDRADHDAGRSRPGLIQSCGRPLERANIRIVDPRGRDVAQGEAGELLLRGRSLMSGYWRAPERTRAALVDGWLHSGDLARMDAQGYVYLVGRLKDIINTGGIKVSPVEVEDALFACPAVADAVVAGIPDPEWGEAVVAFVVPRPGHMISLDALRATLSTHLARFKLPKAVIVAAGLPKTATGKPIRQAAALPDHLVQAARAALRAGGGTRSAADPAPPAPGRPR